MPEPKLFFSLLLIGINQRMTQHTMHTTRYRNQAIITFSEPVIFQTGTTRMLPFTIAARDQLSQIQVTCSVLAQKHNPGKNALLIFFPRIPGSLKNLLLIAERSYFNVEGLVAAPQASAEAVLSEEEKKLGVISIDLGGGTSSFAVFADGLFIHLDSITLGGDHITYDIARSLSTPLQEAERIKTLYGTVVTASSDECEMVAYPSLNEPAQYHL